jgi:hypothetical protein
MIEQMFYYGYSPAHSEPAKNRIRKSQQHRGVWRLKAMRQQLPTFLAITARTAGMVALAMLLILVLLPAMLAAQAASPG